LEHAWFAEIAKSTEPAGDSRKREVLSESMNIPQVKIKLPDADSPESSMGSIEDVESEPAIQI
jgi:hypothetical protein